MESLKDHSDVVESIFFNAYNTVLKEHNVSLEYGVDSDVKHNPILVAEAVRKKMAKFMVENSFSKEEEQEIHQRAFELIDQELQRINIDLSNCFTHIVKIPTDQLTDFENFVFAFDKKVNIKYNNTVIIEWVKTNDFCEIFVYYENGDKHFTNEMFIEDVKNVLYSWNIPFEIS